MATLASASLSVVWPRCLLAQEAEQEEIDDPLLESALRPWTGDLGGMVERGMIRFAVPVGLATYFIDGADQRGVTYDLIVEFEKELRDQLGKVARNTHAVVIPTSRNRLFTMVNEGKADIAAGNLTITPDRLAVVDFSDPLRADVRELVVTGPAAPAVASLDDLVNTQVYVRRSSSFYEHLRVLNEQRASNGSPPFPVVECDENLQTEDLLEMVGAGLIPATVADEPVAQLLADIFENVVVHGELAIVDGQRIGWAFRKESPDLSAAVNGFVAKARKGTYLGNVIFAKYLKSTKWVENALNQNGRAKLSEAAGLIKKFAGQFDFDWLMIAAQAYQESQIDQSKRSHVGAVGVMQILPTTAADPNVAIADIDKIENNIHAGVKYLRFLRNQYFSDEAITPLDQTMFTFAAYNAGPGNISKTRKKAAKMGLDPNVWFDNVEIATAKAISREPVVYCRNILKYYVAFKLVTEPA